MWTLALIGAALPTLVAMLIDAAIVYVLYCYYTLCVYYGKLLPVRKQAADAEEQSPAGQSNGKATMGTPVAEMHMRHVHTAGGNGHAPVHCRHALAQPQPHVHAAGGAIAVQSPADSKRAPPKQHGQVAAAATGTDKPRKVGRVLQTVPVVPRERAAMVTQPVRRKQSPAQVKWRIDGPARPAPAAVGGKGRERDKEPVAKAQAEAHDAAAVRQVESGETQGASPSTDINPTMPWLRAAPQQQKQQANARALGKFWIADAAGRSTATGAAPKPAARLTGTVQRQHAKSLAPTQTAKATGGHRRTSSASAAAAVPIKLPSDE